MWLAFSEDVGGGCRYFPAILAGLTHGSPSASVHSWVGMWFAFREDVGGGCRYLPAILAGLTHGSPSASVHSWVHSRPMGWPVRARAQRSGARARARTRPEPGTGTGTTGDRPRLSSAGSNVQTGVSRELMSSALKTAINSRFSLHYGMTVSWVGMWFVFGEFSEAACLPRQSHENGPHGTILVRDKVRDEACQGS